jgi:type IV pilus assembly protein PilP
VNARFAAAALAVAVLFACASTLAAEPAKADKKEAAPPPAEHTYVAAGKRDPFKDLEIKITIPPIGPTCGSLCDFEVEQFKISALVTGLNSPLAGIEAPNGKVYIVDVNTRIGKRGGRVTKVNASGIVIEEPCAKDSSHMCTTTLGIPRELRANDEDLTRKK